MRWTWAAPVILVALALAAARVAQLPHEVERRDAGHTHSHGHWHGDAYHAHEHTHGEAPTEAIDSHANQPHDHGWSDAPDEESTPAPLVVAPTRRTPWKPAPPAGAPLPIVGPATMSLDRPPPAPPPMARAGPLRPQIAALRSIVLQV
jgi:hypothetical protein